MKIGIITRIGMPLNRDAYGYYYRLHYLANELVARGHEVRVLAHPETETKAKLTKANFEKIEWETQLACYGSFIKKYGKDLDIINAQTDHMCCFFAPFSDTPILNTMIFGQFTGHVLQTLKFYKKQYFSTISQGNKKCYPFLNWQGVVYNGLDIRDFTFSEKTDDYLLFLSRVNHEKGVEEAIKIAKKSKTKLIIAGRSNKDYFNKKIKPELDNNIKYFGIADFKQKIKLFKNAKALLHPHLLPEGFGNSIIEAQACGTPVIAYPYGSSSEVIKNNKTGFIVKDIKEAQAAIKKVNAIKRRDCRKFIEDNFTIKKMVDGYEKMYKKIIKNNSKKK